MWSSNLAQIHLNHHCEQVTANLPFWHFSCLSCQMALMTLAPLDLMQTFEK